MTINIAIENIIVFIILLISLIIYFKIADKFNIIDKPNQRSSHNYITIRGGGIVFWVAGVIYSLLNLPESIGFLIGLTLICGVSFWDDVSSLPNRIRLLVHFTAISTIFYSLNLFHVQPWWVLVISYILFTGILNAYNFMDGINGITGLYSLVILLSLQFINLKIVPFTSINFINYAILACIVFLFFNYRKRAKCFAGDIGSLGIAFWILTLLIQLIVKTNSCIWLFFLAVYGVDSVFTILHRIYLKQNIFEAHRLHFYQILANECNISHLKVSAIYAIIQLSICSIIIYIYPAELLYQIIVCASIIAILMAVYLIKFRIKGLNLMK